MTNLIRQPGLVFNRPQHRTAAASETIAAVIEKRIALGSGSVAVDVLDRPEKKATAIVGALPRDLDSCYPGHHLTPTNVVVIELNDWPVNRDAWLSVACGLTSWEGDTFMAGQADAGSCAATLSAALMMLPLVATAMAFRWCIAGAISGLAIHPSRRGNEGVETPERRRAVGGRGVGELFISACRMPRDAALKQVRG